MKKKCDCGHVPFMAQKKGLGTCCRVFSFKKSTAGAFSLPLALPKMEYLLANRIFMFFHGDLVKLFCRVTVTVCFILALKGSCCVDPVSDRLSLPVILIFMYSSIVCVGFSPTVVSYCGDSSSTLFSFCGLATLFKNFVSGFVQHYSC